MKKSTWAIISLSFCVLALLIVSGVLLVKYKTTDNKLRIDREFEIASSVQDIVRKSGQPLTPMGMMHAARNFYLTYGLKEPIEGNINEGIGVIPSVIIPYRHSDGHKDWAPLVSFEFSKDEYIRSIIVKRLNPKGLLRYSKNIQWEGIDLDSQKKFKFFLQRY